MCRHMYTASCDERLVSQTHVLGISGVGNSSAQCNYFAPLAFPEPVVVGIRVAHTGSSSVRYELALFKDDPAQSCAASGHFVHVYVDRATRSPAALPSPLLRILETLK